MVVEGLAFAVRAFYQCWIWFTSLLNASGLSGLYLSFVAIVIIYRLLIAPLVGQSLGGAGSDRASDRKEE